MTNKIIIGSRKSDLARIQAYYTAEKLKAFDPNIEIDFLFKSSFGDLNLDDDLRSGEHKGVFTADLSRDLLDAKCDMVVHSWKDLPIEDLKESKIAATFDREDPRDLIFFKKDSLNDSLNSGISNLKILTSSPRREYLLAKNLRKYINFNPSEINFTPIRGNIPTRFKKFLASDCDSFVVAKAAIDRLLGANPDEFSEIQSEIKKVFEECNFIVLPLSDFPCAPAQGALAVEILKSNVALEHTLNKLNCVQNFEDVSLEREIFSEYGGGCQSRLGVYVKSFETHKYIVQIGEPKPGVVIDKEEVQNFSKLPQVDLDKVWPAPDMERNFFARTELKSNLARVSEFNALILSRPHLVDVLQAQITSDCVVWASGSKTWLRAAKKGLWVHGSLDSMGIETLGPQIDHFYNKPLKWAKLTHTEGAVFEDMELLPLYELSDLDKSMELKDKEVFYWMSGSLFKRALQESPEIASKLHVCGLGASFQELKKHIDSKRLWVLKSVESYFNKVVRK